MSTVNGRVIKYKRNNKTVVLNHSTLKGFQSMVSINSYDQTPILGGFEDFNYVETTQDKRDGFKEFSKVKLLDPSIIKKIKNEPLVSFDVEEGDIQISSSSKIDLQLREIESKIKEKENVIAVTNVTKNKIAYVINKIIV